MRNFYNHQPPAHWVVEKWPSPKSFVFSLFNLFIWSGYDFVLCFLKCDYGCFLKCFLLKNILKKIKKKLFLTLAHQNDLIMKNLLQKECLNHAEVEKEEENEFLCKKEEELYV